jgi:hypothetical protein
MNFSFSALMASLIFGIFGYYLWRLGKKRGHGGVKLIAIALMVYPYFIENDWALWIIGFALTFFGYRIVLGK